MAADLDALQRQIGMPVIFIEADLPHMAEAYRTLGKILSGKEARGEELAAFVDETVSLAGGKRRENSGFRAHFRPVHLRLVRPQYKRERLHSGAGTRPHGH
ncbi:MAG: hypothetical protein ACLU3I_09270 [Acutalibacteraceae bacterium]